MKHLLPATTHDIKYFSFDANIDVGSTIIIEVATNIATCCTCKKPQRIWFMSLTINKRQMRNFQKDIMLFHRNRMSLMCPQAL